MRQAHRPLLRHVSIQDRQVGPCLGHIEQGWGCRWVLTISLVPVVRLMIMKLLSRLPCSECKTQCSNGKCEISQRYSEGSAWSAYLVSPPGSSWRGSGEGQAADAPCLAASRPYVLLFYSCCR